MPFELFNIIVHFLKAKSKLLNLSNSVGSNWADEELCLLTLGAKFWSQWNQFKFSLKVGQLFQIYTNVAEQILAPGLNLADVL